MFQRFARSWQLARSSLDVLRQDKEMLVFPLCSGLATIVVIASFAMPMLSEGQGDRLSDLQWIKLGLLYFIEYFIIFFFNTALVGMALIRLDGKDPTVADGFRIARSNLMSILGYAAIAATIGLILRIIEERADWIGRIVAGLFGMAFTVATALTVPVLAATEVGPLEAIAESARLLKKTWGENIIGRVGMGAFFSMLYLGIVFIGFSIACVGGSASGALPIVTLAMTILALCLAAMVHSALEGIYAAALYHYADEGGRSALFPDDVMESAFRWKD